MGNMKTEAIELLYEVPLHLNFKRLLARMQKGILVAASVCITASVVSKEETINPGTVQLLDPETVRESVEMYTGVGGEVTEEANSIFDLMEDPIGLTKIAWDAAEWKEQKRSGSSVDVTVPTAFSDGRTVIEDESEAPAADTDLSGTEEGVYALTIEGVLPSNYCVGSTIDLSGITLLYYGEKVALEEAEVKIPDTGKAGNYAVTVEYKGCRTEIPFGVADYRVHLNANGGTCPTDVSYLTNYRLEEEIIPSRPGKDFTGWYRDAACTILFEGAERGETELELYAGWKDYTGFLCDEEGYIIKYTAEGYKIIDGLMVLPNKDGCVGIRAGALDGFEDEIYELYIPAGITDIEPGALDNLSNLFYIEVDPANPVYMSKEGILYSRENGSVVLWPAGR